MKPSKTNAEIAALREAALEDLMAATDAELRQEAIEDGEDFDAIAIQVKASMRDAAAAALRHRLILAKERMVPKSSIQTPMFNRPPLAQIKQLVQSLFLTDRTLGLAFRDGKKQTDADWLSLYDDLVAMGAIKSEDHGN